jgi:hypothetical protein
MAMQQVKILWADNPEDLQGKVNEFLKKLASPGPKTRHTIIDVQMTSFGVTVTALVRYESSPDW